MVFAICLFTVGVVAGLIAILRTFQKDKTFITKKMANLYLFSSCCWLVLSILFFVSKNYLLGVFDALLTVLYMQRVFEINQELKDKDE